MSKSFKVLSAFLVLCQAIIFVHGCSAQVAPTRDTSGSASAALDGAVREIPSMTTQRSVHTATLLRDGKVLITGGYVGGNRNLSTAEVFDPTTGSFTAAGNMAAERSSHTATFLASGKVLITGGYNGSYLDTTEIYDPATNRFTAAGRMTTARSGHVATTLDDGKILFVGGVGTGWTFLKSTEVYDPATGTFTATGDMSTPRESHTATLLSDGRVLVVGGHKDRRQNVTIYTSAEIYDPKSGRFTAAGDLTVKRHKHDATRLADGRVLIIGGSDERDGDGAYKNAETYDPKTGRFTAVTNNMNTARYKLQGTAVLLKNGKVLVAGGANRAEIFDPATNRFSYADGNMGTTRLFSTATLLKSGQVLITGGYHDGRTISAGAWIYRV